MAEPCRVTADLDRHMSELDAQFETADLIDEFRVDAVLDLVRTRTDQRELMIEAIIECLYEDARLFEMLMDEVESGTPIGDVILKEFLACCDEFLISDRAYELSGGSDD